MIHGPSEPVKPNVQQLVDYQSGVPKRKGSRVAYGVAAGICWLGGSIVLFVAIVQAIRESSSVPRMRDSGTFPAMFSVSILFFGVAWYFTHRAAHAHEGKK